MKLKPNVIVGSPGVNFSDLRALAQAHPQTFVQRASELMEKGEITNDKIGSLKALWRATSDIEVQTNVVVHGQTRQITTSAFPLLVGGLSVAGINAAYEGVPTVGEQLVTDRESNKKTMTIANVLSEIHQNLETNEGDDFKLIGAGEERYDIGNLRKGVRMRVTQEMIEEDDMDAVVDQQEVMGTLPAEDIEEQTLKRVTDHYGSAASPAEPYALHLNKTGTQLYNATANNPGTRAPQGTRVTNNPLTGRENLEALRVVLAAMTNSRGKRIAIPVSEMTLLLPDALSDVADTILMSINTPGVENEHNPWGPRGRHRPKRVLTTAKLDDLSASAYYMGWFERQFVRKWKIRLELVTAAGDLMNYLRSRVALEVRVAWDVEIGARDYVYVAQSLAGTTAPADE